MSGHENGGKKELKYDGIKVEMRAHLLDKPDAKDLVFGRQFTDHMLSVTWDAERGWDTPTIHPYGDIPISPAATSLNYATTCFEGMKAFYCKKDQTVRLFRPTKNLSRFNESATASSLPVFNADELLKCIKHLISIDKEWIPKADNCSLYIRPVYIGTEPYIGVHASQRALLYCILCPVGPYFKSGAFNPISVYADPEYVRAWPGGAGNTKVGGNYGPNIRVQAGADRKHCTQVLWLFGEDMQMTELGTMNLFVYWTNEKGEKEIATPPLDGTILPGVTRDSLLELARAWGTHIVTERKITLNDVRKAVSEKRLFEMFGSGTAAVICPVNKIYFKDEEVIEIPTMENGAEVATQLYTELTNIQYGRVSHGDWSVPIEPIE